MIASALSNPAASALATLRRRLLHPYALFLLVCLLVWLPAGLNIGPANDGWRDLNVTPFPWHPALRYFGQLPKVVGLRIVRDGFQGWELMLFIVTVLRAVVVFEIFKRLFPRYGSFAVACGLLALFHPADRVYFWMDSVGLDFDYLAALGVCLAAVVYLQTRSRESLLALVFLQVVLCFSYTAYLPLVVAFSVGIWIFRRMEGQHDSPRFFLAAALPTVLAIALQAFFAVRGRDREGSLMDMHLGPTLSGYLHELNLLLPNFVSVFRSLGSIGGWIALAVVPALLAYVLVRDWHGPASEAEKPARSRRFYAVLVAGLLALAAVSYLPYAVSKIRFGAERQLLAAGLFIYIMLLLPVFFWMLPRIASKRAEAAVLAMLAAFITINGLENRDSWVRVYRDNETFLSALATAIPDPVPGTTILVHVNSFQQTREISGLHHLQVNFQHALEYMYGDATLKGAFLASVAQPFHVEGSGLQVAIANRGKQSLQTDPASLLVVDYSTAGQLSVLDQKWLQQNTPSGSDVSGYRPALRYSTTPSKTAIVCSMLEKPMRPAYCRR